MLVYPRLIGSFRYCSSLRSSFLPESNTPARGLVRKMPTGFGSGMQMVTVMLTGSEMGWSLVKEMQTETVTVMRRVSSKARWMGSMKQTSMVRGMNSETDSVIPMG